MKAADRVLVPALFVVVALGVVYSYLPRIPSTSCSDEAQCTRRLERIYEGLLDYQRREGHLPRRSGVRFFASLVADGIWEGESANGWFLTCAAVNRNGLDVGELPPEEWFVDLDRLTGDWSAFAGRDQARFPLERLCDEEPLVACDNDPESNHYARTFVLYGDGSIRTLKYSEPSECPVVGPGSAEADLRKLSLD